ncbi:MAG: COQ9 family protein [Alphaproteobacteria bacterium]|nr:MAG: COQ9 family protein [Alphaproteobacteria bacterium]
MAKKNPRSETLEARLLEAALPDVAFDGWSDELIAKAAARSRISEDDATEAFPQGPLSLVRYFSEWADDQTLAKLPAQKLAKLKVREKITLGVRTRLECLAPHRQAVSAALAFLALPPRNIYLPKMVWATADKIWRAAGDTATDYNHYTKRLLLSGVLTSTTLYWLNDKSEGSENTWKFLDRRIEDVLKVGGKIAAFRKKRRESA